MKLYKGRQLQRDSPKTVFPGAFVWRCFSLLSLFNLPALICVDWFVFFFSSSFSARDPRVRVCALDHVSNLSVDSAYLSRPLYFNSAVPLFVARVPFHIFVFLFFWEAWYFRFSAAAVLRINRTGKAKRRERWLTVQTTFGRKAERRAEQGKPSAMALERPKGHGQSDKTENKPHVKTGNKKPQERGSYS